MTSDVGLWAWPR